MGLKLSCTFATSMEHAAARHVVQDLYGAAQLLPFDEVTEPCDLDRSTGDLERMFATHHMEVLAVPATEASWFTVYTEGAETTWIGLGARPPVVTDERGFPCATGLGGLCTWQWCCKTQYASLPQHGGMDNFLRAHTSLIALADHARDLGLAVDVVDDGGYWELRDPELLVAEAERWNRRMAAFAGWLLDTLGDELGPPSAPILSHPNFERLEAEGRGDLGLLDV